MNGLPMANDPLPLTRLQPAQAPTDHYDAFYELLTASERGRAFLAEHARRGRAADTEVLLAALGRIEALVRGKAAAQDSGTELQLLVLAIRNARPQIEASGLPAKAAKLAELVDLLEQRIAALAGPLPPDSITGDVRPRLAVVPPPEQPELPIPSPLAGLNPPQLLAPALAVAAPEAAAQSANAVAKERPAAEVPASAAAQDDAKPWTLPAARPVPPPPDPLAAIMMLSEDERLALFT
jgi:hypothetical protein